MEKIDIVVTYVNENDLIWKNQYHYWKDYEIDYEKIRALNPQAFGVERTRDWDCFKYWFRAVEKNCPWVNNVILVVARESQLPEWLNRDNPKLRIVYHSDYIPKQFLPTFNTNVINMYTSLIPDISDNFIICDDDYYFINDIAADKFVRDGKPVIEIRKEQFFNYPILIGKSPEWYQMLNNTNGFVRRITRSKTTYFNNHYPFIRNKKFELDFIKNHSRELEVYLGVSKFRNVNNIVSTVWYTLLQANPQLCVVDNTLYSKSKYVGLDNDMDLSLCGDAEILVLNDNERKMDVSIVKEKMINFLDNKFPNRSSYEIECDNSSS